MRRALAAALSLAAALAAAALSGCAPLHRDMYGLDLTPPADGAAPSDAYLSVAVIEPLKASSRPRWPPFDWTRLAAQNLHECAYTATHPDSAAAVDYGAYAYGYGAVCTLAFLPVTLVMLPADLLTLPFRWDVKAKLQVDGTVMGPNGLPRGRAAVEGRLSLRERVGLVRFGGREPHLGAFATETDAAGRFALPFEARFGSSRVDAVLLDLSVDGRPARRVVLTREGEDFLGWRYDAPGDAADAVTGTMKIRIR